MPRPVRISLWIGGIVMLAFLAFSWLQGYDRIFRDSLTGQLVQVKVRSGPLDAIRDIGELFPEFLRTAFPMLMMMLFYFVIIIIQFVGLFWYLSRGQSYTIYPGEYDVSFDDVRGQKAIVDATKEVVKLFEGFKEFRKMGGYPPHGILFEGPPGTGKTLLGKAIAGQTNVPFLYTNGSAFSSMFMGVGNMKIKALFRKARRMSKEYDGAVVFIDELDAVAGSRGQVSARSVPYDDPIAPLSVKDFWAKNRFIMGGMNGGGMNSMLVNELLVAMDGLVLPSRRFRHIKRILKRKPKVPVYNILIIGATNRAAVLDPALLRPGRFDRKIHVGNPSAEGRKDIFEYYLQKVKHVQIDLDKLASATVGYSPARIKNIVNEGLIFALQDGRDAVTYDDIWQAMLTDEIGLKQPVIYTPWEKEATSIHEAGHAVARWFFDPSQAVTVITIQKREEALGMVVSMELEERFSRTKDEIVADIKVSLAGMAAERLWYDTTTSGPGSDLQAATMRAAQMVAYYGMGPSLLSYGAIPPPAYGGDTMSALLADPVFRAEVDRILAEGMAEVTDLLQRKAHCVEAIRDRLLVDEQLTGEQFSQLMHTLGEPREGGEVHKHRMPPRALGRLRPLSPLPNGEAAPTNGGPYPETGTNGGGPHRPSPSPWARPPE
ncbi:MAG: AAA family ATPase [Acidimicrobiales bacterium]